MITTNSATELNLATLIFSSIAKAKTDTGLSYLGNINISSKLAKNGKVSHQNTYGIYLSPASTSGYNVCSHSTPECRLACLATSGRAAMDLIAGTDIIKNSRLLKTRLFHENTNFFMQWLIAEIKQYQAKAVRDGYGFSIRLNLTSDIDYSRIFVNGKNIYKIFKDVNFYDYTKNPGKFDNKPLNYHLTFSYSGLNWQESKLLLEQGNNIAVVFNIKKNKPLPITFAGYRVSDGDITDYRIGDGKGLIIGLRFKEIADKKVSMLLKQKSAFIVQEFDKRCEYNTNNNVLEENNVLVSV